MKQIGGILLKGLVTILPIGLTIYFIYWLGVTTESLLSKPIKLVAGFPPGGPTDIIGRVIAQALGKELNGTIIIDNRAGAGGVVGADAVAKSKPDGYTLLVAVESSQTRGQALNPTLSYDQLKDFTYVRNVAKQRNLVVVNPEVPVNSIKELIAYAKANPGKLNFGGTFGATSHLGGTLFDARNGPEGHPRPVNDARWALHTGIDPAANAFCLLGRLNGYFRIGAGRPRTRWRYPAKHVPGSLVVSSWRNARPQGRHSVRWGPTPMAREKRRRAPRRDQIDTRWRAGREKLAWRRFQQDSDQPHARLSERRGQEIREKIAISELLSPVNPRNRRVKSLAGAT